MSNNRSLISMDWQEASNGVWYVETTNYKLVVHERTPEEIAQQPSFSKNYNFVPLVYKWNDVEKSWVLIKSNMFGENGSLLDAMTATERWLGDVIKEDTRRIDPGTQLYDNVNRLLENFQMRAMEAARMQEEPRMRGLPPGHPPIRRRATQQLDFTFDPARDIGEFNARFGIVSPDPNKFTPPTTE